MNLEEIEKRWQQYTLETWETKDIKWLISRVKELETSNRRLIEGINEHKYITKGIHTIFGYDANKVLYAIAADEGKR